MSAGDAIDRLKQQAQDGLEKAQRQLDAARGEAAALKEGPQLPPAADADEAAAQVRDLRSRIDQDLAALEARLPPREAIEGQVKRVGGVAAAAVAVLTLIGLVLKQRGERKERDAEAQAQARAIARFLPDALEEVEARRAAAAAGLDDEGGGAGRVFTVIALLGAAAAAVWAWLQRRGGDEPERWEPGPPPPHDELP